MEVRKVVEHLCNYGHSSTKVDKELVFCMCMCVTHDF